MSHCYKCGCPVRDGEAECDPPCAGEDVELTTEQIAEDLRNYESKTVPIDWDKVTTLNDLKEIVRNMLIDDRIWKDSDEFQTLKRFLKSE